MKMGKIKEWPIPVVRDRQGKLAKDYTVKDWYLKEQEEAAESLDIALGICGLDEQPFHLGWIRDEERAKYLEEVCDEIHTRFSKLHCWGYTEEEISAGIHKSNEKARERGLID
jgi:2-iminoacetate synthase ThiH